MGEQGLLLGTLLRRVRARQQEVREILLEDEEPRRRPSFVGKFSVDVDFAEVLLDIRDTLQISPGQQKDVRDQEDFFRLLRRNTEAAGIFVQLAGDLGSWHTAIAPEEFRGFALVDDMAPFVVVNANDAKAAYPFTLVHEIAHVWLGESGVSNLSPFEPAGDTRRIEQICNRIAAEFLVPQQMITREWGAIPRTNIAEAVAALARDWRVSRAVVARRLKDLGQISEENWRILYSTYQEEWKHRAQRLRDQEGGPSYYVTTRSRLGNSLIKTVLGAVDAGTVTYTRASRILGIHAQAFDGLREAR